MAQIRPAYAWWVGLLVVMVGLALVSLPTVAGGASAPALAAPTHC